MATTSGRFVHVWKVASGCIKAVLRYDSDARRVAFGRDGATAATVSATGRVHLWEDVPDSSAGCLGGTATQPMAASWDTPETGSSKAETGEVVVRFNADGSRILSVASDRVARLWETRDLASGPLFEVRDAVGTTFSPDGGQLLIATTDGSIQLVSVADPRPDRAGRRSLAVPADQRIAFDAAVFSHDGGRLATVSGSSRARVWNVATGRELAVLEGHWQPIRSADFSPDGMSVLTASLDGDARVHSVRGVVNTIALSGHESAVNTAVFSHDDEQVLTASSDSTARLWNTDTGHEVARFEGHHNSVVSAAFDADGARVVTASDDGTAQVWDAASAQTLAILDGDGYGFTGAAFSPDGDQVVTSSWDGTARVWDVPTDALTTNGDRPLTLTTTEARTYQHGAAVTGALFTRDGKRLVTSSVDCTARLWDLETVGEEIRRFEGHGMSVLSAVPDADGTALVTASLDGTVRFWNMADGREQRQFKGSESGFNRAEFGPDGKRVVTAADIEGVRLWDTKNGAVVDERGEPPPREVSDNCNRSGGETGSGVSAGLISEADAGEGGSIATRMSTGTTIARLVIEASEEGGSCDAGKTCPDDVDGEGDACEHEQRCQVDANDARFSHDGSKVVVAADDNTVYLWDVLNLEELVRSTLAHLPRRDLTDEERVRFHVAGDY